CLSIVSMRASCCSFFLSAPATTALYTLSLHDALPICVAGLQVGAGAVVVDRRLQHRILQGGVAGRAAILPRAAGVAASPPSGYKDRKSTRLNSSHVKISYAVFCLKKKKTTQQESTQRK